MLAWPHHTSKIGGSDTSWHPNPPPHRSEWVMWAGNVPSDATHDELWRFFTEHMLQQPQQTPSQPQPQPQEPQDDDAEDRGVLSIFLISRSNCAFVNYLSDSYLQRAIARFDGLPLRAGDPRCPRLVCRVRAKDDDLKAGVGGQRGMGMHTKWVYDQKDKARAEEDPAAAERDMSVSPSGDEDGRKDGVHPKHSSSSESYTSTNSSFLANYFPQRYFILKSLTQEDLDISVHAGVWATQKHNEEILDQAFRTSKEVNLIFSVNKSREFYGYARMVGPVLHGEHKTPWASRPPQPPTSQASRSAASAADQRKATTFLSPSDRNRQVDSSPLPIDGMLNSTAASSQSQSSSPTLKQPTRGPHPHQQLAHSAPPLIGERYHLQTLKTPTAKHSLDQRRFVGVPPTPMAGFPLDPSAPVRAMRVNQPHDSGSGSRIPLTAAPSLYLLEEDAEEHGIEAEVEVEVVEEGGSVPHLDGELDRGGAESWGDSFAVQWLCTDRLPFHRTRHLRNPWNHEKEVKVSRDGTELEPAVGHQLLDEWPKLAADSHISSSTPASTPGGARPGPGGKRAAGSRQVPFLMADGSADEIASGKDGGKGGSGGR